jgi:hypothetical protein
MGQPDPSQQPFTDLMPEVCSYFAFPSARDGLHKAVGSFHLVLITKRSYYQAQFNLDFGALDGPDMLDNFDFDSFLNTDTDTAGFGFDPSNIAFPTDSVETGTENGL